MVVLWYGGVGIVGSVEYVVIYGIFVWVVWLIVVYIGRMFLVLWVGLRIYIRINIIVFDLLESFYGKYVVIIGVILMFIYCV